MTEPQWLDWAKRLQAIAQDGMAYTENEYDRDRFEQIRALAAEMLERHAGEPRELWLDLYKKQDGYATPKVDVRAIVIDAGKILLVRERADGLWTPPGGWADPWETPSSNMEREVFEESGYTVRATRLLAVLDRVKQGHEPFPFHAYKLFFECQLLGGAPATSYEILDIGWFSPEALPPLSTGRILPHQIARMFELVNEPGAAADFD